MEIWKSIDKTGYEVSSLGRVRNKEKYVLSPSLTERGYLRVSLFYHGQLHTQKVHRLVAKAFLQCDDFTLTVNHKDCNKQNNVYTNLEWLTRKANYEHGIENNCSCKGEAKPNAVLSEADVYDIIDLIQEGLTDIEIATAYEISHSSIYKIRIGVSWAHIKRPVFSKTGHKKKALSRRHPKHSCYVCHKNRHRNSKAIQSTRWHYSANKDWSYLEELLTMLDQALATSNDRC